MTRIFFTLASFSMILLGAALVVGLTIGDLYDRPSLTTLHWATIHRLTGVAAALGVVFVHCLIVTYFIGTTRWCREVVETYRLDMELVRESNRLKSRTFPWALAGMLAVVGIIALGGAADPATGRENTQAWATWHMVGAFAGFVFIGWTYFIAWNHIFAHQQVIQAIVDHVARIRRQRGLEQEGTRATAREAVSQR